MPMIYIWFSSFVIRHFKTITDDEFVSYDLVNDDCSEDSWTHDTTHTHCQTKADNLYHQEFTEYCHHSVIFKQMLMVVAFYYRL